MPRYRIGSTFLTPSHFPMPSTQPVAEQAAESIVAPLQAPTEPNPIPDAYLEILKNLDSVSLDKCIRAMRNGIAGSPTSPEKSVLRRIANGIGVDDVVALSWSPTYKLYFP